MYGYVSNLDEAEINVVAYARVSTEFDDQISALKNQVDWYDDIMRQHPNWTLVRKYVDEGITGTSAQKRPQFMQMISDAEKGEFSLILTREVSRFARNTVDTLQYTRKLKKLGVEVFFITDNIKTFDPDGELRLTIMASLAQDESRKTSIRTKAGHEVSMRKGVYFGNGNVMGYDKVGNSLVINKEQAETVRRIFDLYLQGYGVRKIMLIMEKEGRKTSLGRTHWYTTTVTQILHNPVYCGINMYHRTYTPDYLDHRNVPNYGAIEKIYVQGTHEPIVTKEEYDRVQEMFAKKTQVYCGRKIGSKNKKNIWVKLLQCQCGHSYCKRYWMNTKHGGTEYAYMCNNQFRNGSKKNRLKRGEPDNGNLCDMPYIPKWKLKEMAKVVFRDYLSKPEDVLNLANTILEDTIKENDKTQEVTNAIDKKNEELRKLSEKLDNLIDMRADGEISKATFLEKKKDVEEKVETVQKEIEELNGQLNPESNNYEERIEILKKAIESDMSFFSLDENGEVPECLLELFVEKILVEEGDKYYWFLKHAPEREQVTYLAVGDKKKHDFYRIDNEDIDEESPTFCLSQGMVLLTNDRRYNRVKIAEFHITRDMVKVDLGSRRDFWNDTMVYLYV